MTKSESEAMYATLVRTALDRELDAWEVEMLRELWDEDVDAQEAAREIEREGEARWMQPDHAGPTNHLLRIC